MGNVVLNLVFSMLLAVPYLGFSQQEILVWSDEFNGSGSPDSAFWSFEKGDHGWGNNEVQLYTDELRNARLEDGKLIIEAHKTHEGWTSARLVSHNKVAITYGRIDFRAKLPSGAGTWPALWLLGENIDTLGWPVCGEIDVMEHVGRIPTQVQCALHNAESNGDTRFKMPLTVNTYATEFHDYQLLWTPDRLEFRVDTTHYYTYRPEVKNGANWPYDAPFFFILNIAMGGNFGSDPRFETEGLKNGIDPTLETARMEVDYVRVYRLADSVANPVLKRSSKDR